VYISIALNQELAFLSLLLKYEKKCLELAYQLAITGALSFVALPCIIVDSLG
jgi:hypothetical protein